MTLDRQTIVAAKADVGVFARELVGQRLWEHQEEVARSQARIRSLLAGRQSGKSRTLSVLSLHKAFVQPDSLVLVISAGEAAARDLLGHIAALSASPILAGSVVDENLSQVRLSNGSRIISVPASMRQIRGKSADRLVVDEGCFVDASLWEAAQFTTIARPNSDIIVASTPFGPQTGWFAQLWKAGDAGVDGYASWRWPSQVSPLVNQEWLDTMRATMVDRAYRAEVEAQWVSDEGSYFSSSELENALSADVPLLPPEHAGGGPVVSAGVDWGLKDANAVSLLGVEPELDSDGAEDRPVYRLYWCEAHHRMPFATFCDRLVDIAEGYYVEAFNSELNGVGSSASQLLERTLADRGNRVPVAGVSTSVRSKEDAFGGLKVLLQAERLALPRHPEMLRQLAALSYEVTDVGSVRIAVPERSGHDDLAMSMCLAAHELPSRIGPKRRGAVTRYYGPFNHWGAA